MSYILDALQRAEQERLRKSGAVPGLQTRAMPVPMEVQAEGKGLATRWGIAALLLVSLLVAMGIALWPTPPLSAPPTTPYASQSALPSLVPNVIPVAPKAQHATAAPRVLDQPKTSAKENADPSGKPIASATATTPAASAPTLTVPAPLPFLKDLPEDFRRQIPALAISGVVYSENPAQRLLLLNGQVLSQGSRAAPDLTLEEIHPHNSEFNFKGTRFKVGH